MSNQEIINGNDFVQGGVYEVYRNGTDYSVGKYFYPTKYPNNIVVKNNSIGKFNKFFKPKSSTLVLLRIDERFHTSNKRIIEKYEKFVKSKIHGKKPISFWHSSNYSYKANLRKLDLSYANFTGSTLCKVDLTGSKLMHANFTGVDFTDSILFDVDLTGAKLMDANFTRVKFGKIKGQPRILPTGYLLKKSYGSDEGYIIGPNLNLTGAILTRIDLTNVNLSYSDLSDSDLFCANLDNADLSDAILTGVKSGRIEGNPKNLPVKYRLINGYIIGPGVNLTDANLDKANLIHLDLKGAILTNADLTRSDLRRVKSGGIKGQPNLPDGYKLINGYIIGPGVNLDGANLAGANLAGVNLTDANLNNANLSGANLAGVNLIDANLNNANLSGANLAGADFTKADFTKADLIGANLAGADFTKANLNNADLSDAILTGVKSGRIEGKPKNLPVKYKLINGYIIGTGVNFTGIDLTDIDLTGIGLNVADLTGFKLCRIKGQPILPKNYKLINGYIFGPNVNLSRIVFLHPIDLTYVNLSGADLSDCQLARGSLLSFANLTGAKLSGANLVDVDLTRANFLGANLTRTQVYEGSLSEKQKSQIIGEPNYTDGSEIRRIFKISKFLTMGKKKMVINNDEMSRSIHDLKKSAIKKQYNKRMIKKRIINSEDRIPEQNEINRIYEMNQSINKEQMNQSINKEQMNQAINDLKNAKSNKNTINKQYHKRMIRKRIINSEDRIPEQNEINRIYENEISKNENETSKNEKEKNYTNLFDFFLDKKNQVINSHKMLIIGENGENAGGLTRSIFDKCYTIFIRRYFEEYNYEENDYIILKDLTPELLEEFEKACEFMINLAIKGGTKIFIKMNHKLLELLKLLSVPESNSNKIFKNKSNQQILDVNNIFSIDHYKKVQMFYNKYWIVVNLSIFTNHIDYSWDEFVKRLKIFLPGQQISCTYENFMKSNNEEINTYPFIQFIFEYLHYSDECRMRFTTFTCGSYTYYGRIYIKIINQPNQLQPIAHTCAQTLDVFINLENSYPKIFRSLFSECKNSNSKNSLRLANEPANEHVNESLNNLRPANGLASEHVNENLNNRRPANRLENEHVNENLNNRRPANGPANRPPQNVACKYSIEKLDRYFNETSFSVR